MKPVSRTAGEGGAGEARAGLRASEERARPYRAAMRGVRHPALFTPEGRRGEREIDSAKLRSVSEALVVGLRRAAPKIGLLTPTLEDIGR